MSESAALSSAVLRVNGIEGGYGSVPIVRNLCFEVGPNECVAILGRNGMGKSTLLRLLIGLLQPTAGSITFRERPIVGLQPHEIARLGIGYVPQGRGIFPKLTVEENLRIGTRASERGTTIPKEVFEYFPLLNERRYQLGGTLSGGEQQMLAIGRALCGLPTVLLLDEPSEGIQPSIVKELGLLLPRIRAKNRIATVIVEQNLDLASRVAERALVMEKGRIVFACHGSEIKESRRVHKYLTI
jgi:urea ABC transporter ATP-binding protein UrtE